jgi:hypothetical protein
MHVTSKLPEIRRILDAARVNGKNNGDVVVKEFRGPISMNSYWDGGRKDEFVLIDLASYEVWHMPTSHPYFDRRPDGQRMGNVELAELPPGACLVQGGYFCGKPSTIRIHLRPENMAKLLPKPGPTISDDARKALNIIGGIKSSYRSDEFRSAKLGPYHPTNHLLVELREAGLIKINKAGAVSITTAGKNAR